MKTILIHISGAPGQRARLQAGLDIARAFGSHVTLCQPAPPPLITGGLAPGTMWTMVNFQDIEKAARKARAAIQSKTEEILSGEDVPWDWIEVAGFSQDAFALQTALADLAVVTLQDEEHPFGKDGAFVSHVLTQSAAPVLAMPETASRFNVFGNALIAWDGSLEAAKAVKAAIPMLQKASDIMAISVGAIDAGKPSLSDLAVYLSRNGLEIAVDDVAKTGRVSDTLLQAAKASDAAYIVMGAYGHWRLLETILGGETERMLSQSQVPVFFSH